MWHAVLLPLFGSLQPVGALGEPICWPGNFARWSACCRNPPFGDDTCWQEGLSFDLCCTRWLHPRSPTAVKEGVELELEDCMRRPAPVTSDTCSTSAYAPMDGAPIGKLLWCTVKVGRVRRVLDVFLGSGCSAATALASMDGVDGAACQNDDFVHLEHRLG